MPTTPTAPTPTTLSVQVSIVAGGAGATLNSLDIGPAKQHRVITIDGRVSAQGGNVTGLNGTFTLTDANGLPVVERDLDALFATTPSLAPGADLVFDDVEVPFDTPFPAVGTVQALVEVSGMDSLGQVVQAETTVPVAVQQDTRINANPCVPDDATACALGDRFQINVTWQSPNGMGTGQVVPTGRFSDGAFFFFSNPNTQDLLVQLLNACSNNDHFWVFASATTDVGFEMTVEDTMTGTFRAYTNPLGNPAPAITDTQAFATCP